MIFVKRDRSNQPKGLEARNKQRSRVANELRRSGHSATDAWSRIRRRQDTRADINGLFAVFYRKCAYCESDFNATGRNQLEHYRPKAKFFEQMFLWSNWLCSCGICNEKKWSHWPVGRDGKPSLLDPTGDDPGEHLGFVDAAIVGVTPRGIETIRMLGLDRQELERERRRWLLLVNSVLILTLHSKRDLAESAKELLVWSVQPWAPYCAMVRSRLDLLSPGYSERNMITTALGDPVDLFEKMSMLVEGHAREIAQLLREPP